MQFFIIFDVFNDNKYLKFLKCLSVFSSNDYCKDRALDNFA